MGEVTQKGRLGRYGHVDKKENENLMKGSMYTNGEDSLKTYTYIDIRGNSAK